MDSIAEMLVAIYNIYGEDSMTKGKSVIFNFYARAKGFKEVNITSIYIRGREVFMDLQTNEEGTDKEVRYMVSFLLDSMAEEYRSEELAFEPTMYLKPEIKALTEKFLKNLTVYQEVVHN